MNSLVNISPSHAQNIVQNFISLIQQGYQNPEGITGSISITVPDYPECNFTVNLGRHLHIHSRKGKHTNSSQADTCLTIPLETLQRICNETEHLDFRDPNIIGTIYLEGNLDLANHIGKACLTPSQFVQDRFNQVAKIHSQQGYKHLDAIMSLHTPNQMQLLQALETHQPFTITGAANHCQQWNLDKLAQHFGEAVVRVRSAEHHQTMKSFIQELNDFQKNPYQDMVEGFVKPYTEGAPLPEAMWDDFGPLFFNREDYLPPQLWLGAVPTHIPTSSLHRDPHTGFLLQVMGNKKLELYSADQADLLYPHKAYNNYQPCWFKPESPDYQRYPKAKAAKSITATVKAGEILVQPAGWFHQVYALDSPNMSVSYFWRY